MNAQAKTEAKTFDRSKVSLDSTKANDNMAYLAGLGYTTVSAQIRFLLGQGFKRGEVAKVLNKRYQHVRNVEITPIKRQG